MNDRMKTRKAYWIGGTAAALLGVGLVRLAAPELAGAAAWAAQAAGYVLVTAGIGTLGLATRRQRSDAFVTVAGGPEPLSRGPRSCSPR